MISNLVNQKFNTTQMGLYEIPMKLSNSSSKERDKPFQMGGGMYVGENNNPVISRIIAIPITAIDLSLECIRSLVLVVESVFFTAISTLIVLRNALRFDALGTGKSIRHAILNLEKAVYNAALFPIKIIILPITYIVHILRCIYAPQVANPTFHYMFIEENKDQMFERYANVSKKMIDFIDNYTTVKDTSFKHCLKSRVFALGIAFIDTGLGVAAPLVYAAIRIYWVARGLILLPLYPLIYRFASDETFGSLVGGLISGLFEGLITFQALAQVVTRTAMLPITLIAQVGVALSNPNALESSEKWLYKSQIGDQRLSFRNQGGLRIVVEAKTKEHRQLNNDNEDHLATLICGKAQRILKSNTRSSE